MSGFRTIAAFSSLLFLIFGCTKHPQADNGQIASIIATRINQQVEWYQGCPDDQMNENQMQQHQGH